MPNPFRYVHDHGKPTESGVYEVRAVDVLGDAHELKAEFQHDQLYPWSKPGDAATFYAVYAWRVPEGKSDV